MLSLVRHRLPRIPQEAQGHREHSSTRDPAPWSGRAVGRGTLSIRWGAARACSRVRTTGDRSSARACTIPSSLDRSSSGTSRPKSSSALGARFGLERATCRAIASPLRMLPISSAPASAGRRLPGNRDVAVIRGTQASSVHRLQCDRLMSGGRARGDVAAASTAACLTGSGDGERPTTSAPFVPDEVNIYSVRPAGEQDRPRLCLAEYTVKLGAPSRARARQWRSRNRAMLPRPPASHDRMGRAGFAPAGPAGAGAGPVSGGRGPRPGPRRGRRGRGRGRRAPPRADRSPSPPARVP